VCEEIENTLYEKRADINREIKLITGEIEGYRNKIPDGYNIEEAKEIDLKVLFEKISESNKINSNIQRAKHIMAEKENNIKSIKEKSEIEIDNLLQKIENIKKRTNEEIEVEIEKTKEAEKYINEKAEINIDNLEKEYKEKEEYKSFIRIADELENKKTIERRKKEESETLTKKLDFIRDLPGELLRNAEMPVDGLTYTNGKININGRPIINLSGGERIKFVMDVVRKISGELKLILINGFEALNEQEQQQFIESCKDDGFQYFITKTCDNETLNLLDVETGEIF
jgi:chromosome segregation ATPase